jgi:putative salt-induced outer membrane protein
MFFAVIFRHQPALLVNPTYCPQGDPMLRTAIFVLALVPIVHPASAQTSPKPDGQWRGSFGAGATATAGNNESVTYTVTGDAVRQTPIDKLSGYVQSIYGRRDVSGTSERTSELIRAGGAYTRDFNERSFGFGALDLERNKLIDLNLRSVIAGGVGYHVIKREGLAFDLSTGPAYNREEYTTKTRDALEWLFAEESTHALTPAVSFKQRFAYYPNLRDTGEYRIVFDTGLVFKITDSWNATVTLNDRYQSNPLPGVKNNDMLFVTGFQYVLNP